MFSTAVFRGILTFVSGTAIQTTSSRGTGVSGETAVSLGPWVSFGAGKPWGTGGARETKARFTLRRLDVKHTSQSNHHALGGSSSRGKSSGNRKVAGSIPGLPLLAKCII